MFEPEGNRKNDRYGWIDDAALNFFAHRGSWSRTTKPIAFLTKRSRKS